MYIASKRDVQESTLLKATYKSTSSPRKNGSDRARRFAYTACMLPTCRVRETTLRLAHQALPVTTVTLNKEKNRIQVNLEAADGAVIATLDLPQEAAWDLLEYLGIAAATAR